ncbi:unnamed protein product [Thelazia callipaeda]|uniref:Anoctamin n=1 Tax=Thelazia callipaeda TaxID=103827 RepID=A0A0N5CSL6_THECL|nr:unnamed protein product [Thelazia callipaeda]
MLETSLSKFLRGIILESVFADAVLDSDRRDKWIKYDMNDFKKQFRKIVTFGSWEWLLSFLRIIFFIIGSFVLAITICALCGFACMLSTVVRDDYYNRRLRRQREVELRNLAEQFQGIALVMPFEADFLHCCTFVFILGLLIRSFQGRPNQLNRNAENDINTAVEQLSIVSSVW